MLQARTRTTSNFSHSVQTVIVSSAVCLSLEMHVGCTYTCLRMVYSGSLCGRLHDTPATVGTRRPEKYQNTAGEPSGSESGKFMGEVDGMLAASGWCS